MKVNLNWLKDFVNIDISVDELAKRLTDQGVSVENIENVGDDYVFDLEITPNRPDLLSVFGIAREIKAMLKKKFNKNPFRINENFPTTGNDIQVTIEAESDCPRYTGCYIENVKVDSSPEWLTRRLELTGIRPLNNIVDITNYVLLEMGHPLHAFDAEKIEGNRIKVRRATSNESIVTLDEVERKLDSNFLVIADEKKPVAIAGIMGGENSCIDEGTKNIFIESAYFDPTLIRKESKKLKLSTESSYRFERKADITALIPALLRVKKLVESICGGKMKGGITDINDEEVHKHQKVYFTIDWLNNFLGSELSKKEAIESLSNLDFKLSGDSNIAVEVPPFRRDIENKEDIAEEVVRMVGFNNIPFNKTINFSQVAFLPENTNKIERVKDYFVSIGFSETINISFVSEEEIRYLGDIEKSIAIRNPITANFTHLRPTLIPGLMKTLKRNISVGLKDIQIFEVGNVFIKDKQTNRVNEPLELAAVANGRIKSNDWRGENRNIDYYDLKGTIEGLFDTLRINNVIFEKPTSNEIIEIGADIYINKKKVGTIGKLNSKIKELFDISGEVLFAELALSTILDHFDLNYHLQPLPKYPALLRDLCLLVPENVTNKQIEDTIKETGSDILEDIQLFDVYTYTDKKSNKELRSLTYSITFRSNTSTLNGKLIDNIISDILANLQKTLGVQLRGK
ncbi:MAG: phenylalanine--tRNA ligase subunit beta [Candidatus Cloacimonas sp. 4484_209]|nr:MAG: phenylalanine--tRNA ligase subunit beta [Candidatus Cloacimonas sp. 4484_209]